MRATKHELTIRIEVLDKDVIKGMLQAVYEQIGNEVYDGLLQYADGDMVSWDIVSEQLDL